MSRVKLQDASWLSARYRRHLSSLRLIAAGNFVTRATIVDIFSSLDSSHMHMFRVTLEQKISRNHALQQ
jgi:hypothetical protein